MANSRCQRTPLARILWTTGFLLIVYYAIVWYSYPHTPTQLRKLKTGRRFVMAEYPKSALTDRSILSNPAALDDKVTSNKTATSYKVSSNGVVNNVPFSDPLTRQNESRNSLSGRSISSNIVTSKQNTISNKILTDNTISSKADENNKQLSRSVIRQNESTNSSTDIFISSNTIASNDTFISHKTGTVNKTPSKETTHDIQLPFPPIKDYESRIEANLDVNIDRVYGCGRNSMNVVRPKEERIPRIIHFMWTTEIIPSVFVDNLKTFVKHNPTWTYYFWTAVSSERFIKEHYPQLLNIIQGYPHYMSRYDATRYAIIYFYGGAYFDLDTTCIKPLDPLLETEECIVAPEPMEHPALVLKTRSLLGSCVFLCKPRHGFIAHILTELDKTKHENDILKAAGPLFFTHAFKTYIASCLHGNSPDNESIHVMSGEYFLDKVKDEAHKLLKQKCTNATSTNTGTLMLEACAMWRKRNGEHQTLSAKAYTVHLYFSTYFNKHLLDQRPENNIKNIIPNVKMY